MVIVAAAGFLIAVLWFDLMFDVQVFRHRRESEAPEPVLASIAGYYRRVTTEASPMGRLVGLVMAVLWVALIWQAIDGAEPPWVSAVSIPAALIATGLAAARVLGRARRLGTRAGSAAEQSALARGILRDHLVCLAAMSVLLAAQLTNGLDL